MVQPVYFLDDWRIVLRRDTAGRQVLRLNGSVGGHRRFRDGEKVTTSPVTGYRLESKSVVVVTGKGSNYRLGMPAASEISATERLLGYLADLAPAASGAFDEATRAPRLDGDEAVGFVPSRSR